MTDTPHQSHIYIDTNIFIGAFESEDYIARDLQALFDRLKTKPKFAVTSELTLAELAVRGSRSRRFYLGLILHGNFIDLKTVSRDILLETGHMREFLKQSGRSLKLPDAIHCVTAVKTRCKYVLSWDKRLAIPHPLQLVEPGSAGLALINQALDA